MTKNQTSKTLDERRKWRAYQAKHRKSARSYLTLYEDAAIALAWECGDLSEGQAARIWGVDRVTARARRIAIRDEGVRLCEILAPPASAGDKE